jgi:hypothetical protein
MTGNQKRARKKFLALALSPIISITASIQLAPSALAAACTPETTTSGIYTIVAFKTVGSCTWSTPTGTNVFRGLIVAGGGGGGTDLGGGGGGGGYVEFESLTVTNDVLTIVVGNGGAGATTISSAGVSGENSSISGNEVSLISRGGAGGASHYNGGAPARSNGGSGGGQAGVSYSTSGSSNGTQTSQSQTPSLSSIGGAQFGFNGSVAGTNWYPAGGGGAGGNGAHTPATGGAGRSNAILGTTYFWAGGGGGAGWSGAAGSGGTGGGAGGGASGGTGGGAGASGLTTGGAGGYVGGNGGTNTGGGGGGGTHNTYTGGNGGSGIVVLRYLTFSTPTTFSSTTTTPTKTTSPIDFSIAFAQSVDSVANGDFSNAGTATGCSFAVNAASGTTFTLTVSSCSEGTLIPQILAGSMRAVNSGANGPAANTLTTTPITIDRTAPTISAALTGPSNATYIPGQSLTFTAPFSETVTVTGTPRLALTIGSTTRYANYASGSNSRTLTFTYVVQTSSSDIDTDGIAVSTTLDLNSGAIADLATNALSPLTFTAPTLTSVLVAQTPAAPTITSITPSSGTLSVAFTAGATNGSAITNYQYSTNNGVNWTTRSPVATTSPISITGLSNGTAYNVRIRAVNAAGSGESSTAVSATPSAVVISGDATLTTTYGSAASTGTYSSTGGTGPYTYTLSATPSGVSISGGVVTASASTAAGTYTQNVVSTDSASQTGSKQLVITVNKASTTITISLPNSATDAPLGGAITITATVSQAGSVNFKLGGSSISGCSSVSSSAGTATCSWTPGALGGASLTAVLTPSDSTNYEVATTTTLSVTVVNGVTTVSLSLAGGVTQAPKGQNIVITATVDQAGRISFFADGKRIAGCYNKAVSGSTKTCTWKPTVQKQVTLTSTLNPTNSAYSNSTGSLKVWVVRRTGTR